MTHVKVLLASLAFAIAPCALAQSVVGTGTRNPSNGHWYYLASQASWSSAANFATQTLHGSLVTINDAAENQWVRSTFAPLCGCGRFWIGLNDVAQEGVYRWQSGEPVTYTNWEPGQPDNNGGIGPEEDGVEMGLTTPPFQVIGAWNDLWDLPGGNYSIVETTTPVPLAHYSFEGNFNDSSPNHFNAIAHGGAGFGIGPPGLGTAADFDGVNDWLEIVHGGVLSFDLDTESYTVAAWFHLEDLPNSTNEPCIIQDRLGTGNGPVSYNIIFLADVSPQLLASNTYYGEGTGTAYYLQTPAAGLVGQWHHVALTYDHNGTGEKRFYIDGRLATTPSPRPNEPFPGGNAIGTTIGGYINQFGNATNFFKGQIDDLRIYNAVLTEAEIIALATPAVGACDDIDFNNDALFPDTRDIDAFLSVFSGGPCLY